ncbi:hypothetical protein MAMMFC1_03455 [Methylomusa anaerophila]|uniref:Uncharacterized protein n=1 Tax=Methylomusa anaerophila TaxID=1930071 RepID=A0A348ANW1_9FIRM|nr:hypothetical protein MAMMFC1_03455 [Methylomusa anaerophila]
MSPEIVKWIGSLTKAGFKIILVSNSGVEIRFLDKHSQAVPREDTWLIPLLSF